MAEPIINTDLAERIAEIRKEEGRGPACEGGVHSLDADRRCERCGRIVELPPDDGMFFAPGDAWDIAIEAKTVTVARAWTLPGSRWDVISIDTAIGPDVTAEVHYDENGDVDGVIWRVTPAEDALDIAQETRSAHRLGLG